MPSWNELLAEFTQQTDDPARATWLTDRTTAALDEVGRLRGSDDEPRNVILYTSAFLQKPQLPIFSTGITAEDLNAFMAVIYQMDCDRGLTLVLHTPGGQTNAAETIVAYLRSKFDDIEVIVPALAMSAGTMITLSALRIVMGRQSQLGPIDPQLVYSGRSVSAQAVVDQFAAAREDILTDVRLAHVWAPILQSQGPSLLQEAQNALAYGERMVAGWLETGMFEGREDAKVMGANTAHHFNDATTHKSHGRRIDRDEARAQNLEVEDLEISQTLEKRL